MAIEVRLECVRVGNPGEGDEYEPWFYDTETEESSSCCVVEATGTVRLGRYYEDFDDPACDDENGEGSG